MVQGGPRGWAVPWEPVSGSLDPSVPPTSIPPDVEPLG